MSKVDTFTALCCDLISSYTEIKPLLVRETFWALPHLYTNPSVSVKKKQKHHLYLFSTFCLSSVHFYSCLSALTSGWESCTECELLAFSTTSSSSYSPQMSIHIFFLLSFSPQPPPFLQGVWGIYIAPPLQWLCLPQWLECVLSSCVSEHKCPECESLYGLQHF